MAKTATVPVSGSLNLIGFGFDGTACFRKGTRYGPDALRDVSEDIESYSPYLDADLEQCRFVDMGNLQLGDSDDVEQQWQSATDDFERLFGALDLEKDKIRIMTIGGEHSISYAPIKNTLSSIPIWCWYTWMPMRIYVMAMKAIIFPMPPLSAGRWIILALIIN